MEQNSNLTLFIPLTLSFIMLGLGLSLTIEDFKRVLHKPRALVIGLMCQMVLLPAICFAICIVFLLPPALAVGLMLLAASPNGATANFYSNLAKGDVALSISLTAINSIITLFTLPLVVNFSIDYFMQGTWAVPIQFKKVIEVFLLVLIPVAAGMAVNHFSPQNSKKLEKPMKLVSAVLLALLVIEAAVKEKDQFLDYFQQMGLPCLAFNLISLVIGYHMPLALSINKKQAMAIGMGAGIHNVALTFYIAVYVIGNSIMGIPTAVYGLIMFFTAAIFGYLANREKEVIA